MSVKGSASEACHQRVNAIGIDAEGRSLEGLQGALFLRTVVVDTETAADSELPVLTTGKPTGRGRPGKAKAGTEFGVAGLRLAWIGAAGFAGVVDLWARGEDLGLLAGDEAGDASPWYWLL